MARHSYAATMSRHSTLSRFPMPVVDSFQGRGATKMNRIGIPLSPRHAIAPGKIRRSPWLEVGAVLLAALCIVVAYKAYEGPKTKQGAAAGPVLQEEL